MASHERYVANKSQHAAKFYRSLSPSLHKLQWKMIHCFGSDQTSVLTTALALIHMNMKFRIFLSDVYSYSSTRKKRRKDNVRKVREWRCIGSAPRPQVTKIEGVTRCLGLPQPRAILEIAVVPRPKTMLEIVGGCGPLKPHLSETSEEVGSCSCS
ncbi:hypothetical protein U1Q18_034116 [Sarracenia purpurea var. burkii]